MPTPVLSPEEFLEAREAWRAPAQVNYLVMYSSLWNAFVTDPTLWLHPVDDHMVHRGDAVFEAVKCQEGRLYCLEQHLARLENSAAALGLSLPPEYKNARELAHEMIALGGEKNTLLRLMISRGPGGFTVNPYECPKSVMIMNTLRLRPTTDAEYQKGARLFSAPFPAQLPMLARVKSSSYVYNVLMKKSAIDNGAEYGVAFSPEGFLAEGATENVALISSDGRLLAPKWDGILHGVTLSRVLAKGEELVCEGLLAGVEQRDVSREETCSAAELFITSTGPALIPIVEWDGRPVGDGRPGPISLELLRRVLAETLSDNEYTEKVEF